MRVLRRGIPLILLLAASTFGQAPTPRPGLSEALIEKALEEYRPRPPVIRLLGDPTYVGLDEELRRGVRLRRGVVLTPYMRVALYRARLQRRPNPETLARLTAPELWVVVFPYSPDRARAVMDKPSPWRLDADKKLDGFGLHGGKVFVPTKLEMVVRKPKRRKLEPLWLETRDFEFAHWFADEWIPRRSIAAAFPLDDIAVTERTARIEVEGWLETEGREQFDSWTFPLEWINRETWPQ